MGMEMPMSPRATMMPHWLAFAVYTSRSSKPCSLSIKHCHASTAKCLDFWLLWRLHVHQETLFMQNIKHCLHVLPQRLGFTIVSKRAILSSVQLFWFKLRDNVGNSEENTNIIHSSKGVLHSNYPNITSQLEKSRKLKFQGWFSLSVHYPQRNIVEIFHPNSPTGCGCP